MLVVVARRTFPSFGVIVLCRLQITLPFDEGQE